MTGAFVRDVMMSMTTRWSVTKRVIMRNMNNDFPVLSIRVTIVTPSAAVTITASRTTLTATVSPWRQNQTTNSSLIQNRSFDQQRLFWTTRCRRLGGCFSFTSPTTPSAFKYPKKHKPNVGWETRQREFGAQRELRWNGFAHVRILQSLSL